MTTCCLLYFVTSTVKVKSVYVVTFDFVKIYNIFTINIQRSQTVVETFKNSLLKFQKFHKISKVSNIKFSLAVYSRSLGAASNSWSSYYPRR